MVAWRRPTAGEMVSLGAGLAGLIALMFVGVLVANRKKPFSEQLKSIGFFILPYALMYAAAFGTALMITRLWPTANDTVRVVGGATAFVAGFSSTPGSGGVQEPPTELRVRRIQSSRPDPAKRDPRALPKRRRDVTVAVAPRSSPLSRARCRASLSVAAGRTIQRAADLGHLRDTHRSDVLTKVRLPDGEQIHQIDAGGVLQTLVDAERHLGRGPSKRRRDGRDRRRVQHAKKGRAAQDQHRTPMIRGLETQQPDLSARYPPCPGHVCAPRRSSTSCSNSSALRR